MFTVMLSQNALLAGGAAGDSFGRATFYTECFRCLALARRLLDTLASKGERTKVGGGGRRWLLIARHTARFGRFPRNADG